MSKVTNKQIAKVFKNAKKSLATEYVLPDYCKTHRYICHAIYEGNKVWKDLPMYDPPQVSAAIKIIESRIAPFNDLESWISIKTGIDKEKLKLGDMQLHRHAWLKMLIAEFDK